MRSMVEGAHTGAGCGGEIASAIATLRIGARLGLFLRGRAPGHTFDHRTSEEICMSVDHATVRRIAHLARIAVADDEVEHLRGELNAILAFVEQLSEVDVEGVEPMTSVTPMTMKKRADVVTDGEIADFVVKNAPASENHFFLVPKVVE
jgi:aspartyl-tRNA(Asn)/glutamyl-tRNA(Gln) amidotransferase subunit C